MTKILAAARPYFAGDAQTDDDLIQAGVEGLLTGLTKMEKHPKERVIGPYISSNVKKGIHEELLRRDRIRSAWKPQESQETIIELTQEVFSKSPYGLPDDKIQSIAAELSAKSGYPQSSCETYIRYKNSFVQEAILKDEEDLIKAPVRDELKEEVEEILDLIDNRKSVVIRARFGMLKGRKGIMYTLDDTGEMIGVGRERARQIEEEILRKLRRHSLGMRLIPYYYPEKFDYFKKQDKKPTFEKFRLNPPVKAVDITETEINGQTDCLTEYALPSGRKIDDFRLRYRYPTLNIFQIGKVLSYEIETRLNKQDVWRISDLMRISDEKLSRVFPEEIVKQLRTSLNDFLEADLEKKILGEYKSSADFTTP